MKYHIVRFRVRQDALELLWGVMKKAESEGIELLDVSSDTNVTKTITRNYVGGVKNKGIKGSDLVLQSLPATAQQLTDIFVKNGFAIQSSGATVSKLMSSGKVKRDENGKYLLHPAPKK